MQFNLKRSRLTAWWIYYKKGLVNIVKEVMRIYAWVEGFQKQIICKDKPTKNSQKYLITLQRKIKWNYSQSGKNFGKQCTELLYILIANKTATVILSAVGSFNHEAAKW